MAAYWASAGGQIVKLPVSTSTGRRMSSGTSIQPSRQPVIEKYLENDPKVTPVREVCQADDVPVVELVETPDVEPVATLDVATPDVEPVETPVATPAVEPVETPVASSVAEA